MSAAPSLDPSGQAVPAPPALGADAAHDLYERYAGAIYAYCFNRLGGREEAEDAVQTTFLNAFRALRRGVVPEHESAWLYKIAENVCHGRHRSAGRRLEVVQDPTVLADSAPTAQGRGDELLGLDQALERMAPRQRRALLLREWRGLSYREIAQELRLSPAAVETLLFRARRSLARNLQVGSLLPWLKSLFGGSAALKGAVAAGVVAVSVSLGGGAPPVETREGSVIPVRPAQVGTTVVDRGQSAPAAIAPRGRGQATRSDPARADGRRELPPVEVRDSRPATSPAVVGPGATPPAREVAPNHPATSTPTPPPASTPTTPSSPTPPATPPVSLPPVPPPTLPQLPPLPQLPQLPSLPPPPLPPAPQLPSVPPVPPVPPVPELPPLPELPQLPELP